ncbi:carotenoid biosynthesis protein [Reichenbachiella versicolor]|uniref:carotenoid biosynthesis protein n=1 Tax=Reichenbachiella versicolor TaxID=1821036 RepID=UPI000D6DF9C1|nr:carotenoid biosynthesis protein [Reichenbachiella versicolor]
MFLTLKKRLISIQNKNILLGIFILWLFHISAIIGISIGYHEWFVTKTPLNLLLVFLITMYSFQVNSIRKAFIFLIPFSIGMLVEIIGVATSFPFGQYSYGNNLGIKLFDVPLVIGINWVVLSLVTSDLSKLVNVSKWIRYGIASFLMVVLDFFIEPVAPKFDFWEFSTDKAPLENYISWFLIAYLIQFLMGQKIQGDKQLSIHTFLVQVVFFGFFYLLYA